MSRVKRWIRRVMLTVVVTGLALSVGAAYIWHDMKRRDREHARFLDLGQSINLFLKNYAQGLVEAHRQGKPDTVLAYYAPDFRSGAIPKWGDPKMSVG